MENDKIKYYKRFFISPGIVEYDDNGREILLLKKETLDNSYKDIIGKPVIITHNGDTQIGIVVDAYYNFDKGYYVCGFNIWNEQAKNLLDNKEYSVSCTYNIKDTTDGGLYHNIKYDKEITGLGFKNLALVKDPRFQEAKDYVNSRTNEDSESNSDFINNNNGEKKMSFFNKKKQDENLNKDEIKENANEDFENAGDNFEKFKNISLYDALKMIGEETAYHKNNSVNSKTENNEEENAIDEEKEEELIDEQPKKPMPKDEEKENADEDLWSFLESKGLSDQEIDKVEDLIIKLINTIGDKAGVKKEEENSANEEEELPEEAPKAEPKPMPKEEDKEEEKEEAPKKENLKLNSISKSDLKKVEYRNSISNYKTRDEIIAESNASFYINK